MEAETPVLSIRREASQARSWASRPLCVLIGIVGTATIATAQSSGTFSRASDMTIARSGHSATLLPNGQVLIAGGTSTSSFSSTRVLDSAEVYDPEANAFRSIGTMTTARRMHTATLLPDGTVLIVGGYDEGGALAGAELYDPVAGTFRATGSLGTARGGHTAILLPTGKVLVIGGYGTRAYPDVAPAELYDPASRTFSAAGGYVGRGGCDFCAPSVLLSDGTVLFPGQYPAQLYDPRSDSFSPGGMMISDQQGAVALTNGKVLFAGGVEIGRSSRAELYDPGTHTFASTGNMAWPRDWHTLTWLPNGMVLAAGGETESCTGNACTFAGSVASAELYDPSTGAFFATGSMAAIRSSHTATLLRDGRVLVAGGVAYGGIGIFYGSLASAEVYTPDVLVAGPALVTASGDGRGQGAIFHAGTTHLATPGDPAAANEDLDIYATGLRTDSAFRPQVALGGRIAPVQAVSQAPGVPGVNQVRVRVPPGVEPGPAVPVRLTYVDRPSNEVTIAVR